MFVVNPHAGGGSAAKVAVPLARRLREAGAEVETTYTNSPADVPAVVNAAAAEGQIVVAVGGDGMVSSVTGPAADAGAVLAVIPAGRGNDFARMLQVPADIDAQAALLLTGVASPIDLLAVSSVSGLRVAGSVYAGVDARAATIVDRSRLPKSTQYPVAAIRALATYQPIDLTLTISQDGARSTSTHRAANVVVANSQFYGKGMAIAPSASLTDGLLDVIVIEAASRQELIRSLPKVYSGKHVELDEVQVLRGQSVTLSGRYAGGGQVPVGADGEGLPDLPGDPTAALRIDALPEAVQILR